MIEICQKSVVRTDLTVHCSLTWRISHALAKATHQMLRFFEQIPAMTSGIDQRCLAQDLHAELADSCIVED